MRIQRIGVHIKIRQLIVFVLKWAQKLISQSQIQCESLAHLPGILEISGQQNGACFHPGACAVSAAIDSAEKEIANGTSSSIGE